MPPPPEPLDPWTLFASAPVPLRVVVGVAGGVLLVAGRRAWPVLVALPGVLLGVAAALALSGWLVLGPAPTGVIAVVAGLVGGLVARFVERLALLCTGALAALAGVQAVAPLVHGPVPWYGWPLAALVGAVLFPLAWRLALAPITAFIGAAAVVAAAGQGERAWLVVGLAVAGLVVQLATGRKREEGE